MVILLSLVAAAILLLIAGYSLYMYNAMTRPKPAGPVLLVEARYAEASVETMDQVVIAPLFVTLYGTQNVEDMLGVSTAGGKGQIYLYLRPKTQVGIIQPLVQNRIAQIAPTLPTGVAPTVRILEEEPPLWLLLGGSLKPDPLAVIAEQQLLPEAAKLEGVSQAYFAGLSPGESLRGPSLYIDINREKVKAQGISMFEVNEAIRRNFNKPGATVEAIRKQTVKGRDGKTVSLGDLVRIDEVTAFRSVCRWGGRQVIAIALVPEAGETTARLHQRLAPLIPALREKLPKGAELTLLQP